MRRERLVGLALALTLAGTGVSCGSDPPARSQAAFCSTLHSEKQRILREVNAGLDTATANHDQLLHALGGLGVSIQALGEVRVYFRRLADVAPKEIQTPMALVRDDYENQFQHISELANNPLGALLANLFMAMASSGPATTVNSYAVQHCGESL